LPTVIPGTRISAAIFIAIISVVLVYVILNRTTLGYQIKSVGYSTRAAGFAGINVSRILVLTMIISSGLSGIAGMTLLAGLHHRLLRGFSPGGTVLGFWGYGYMAIAVALLAKNRPLATIATATLFGFLESSGYLMDAVAGVSRYIMIFVEAIVLLSAAWLYKIR
jgi:simple sugar transport system permease protein